MSRIIFCEGDSISAGGYPTLPTQLPGYITSFYPNVGQAYTVGTNFAIGAAIIGSSADPPGTNSIYGRQSAVLAAYTPGLLNILVIAIGTNTSCDHNNLNNLLAYYDTMRAAGFVVVGCTILPVGLPPGKPTNRTTIFNPGILAAVGTHLDAVCDWANDPIMGPDHATLNPLLFEQDYHVHPLNYGHFYMANVLFRTLETLITAGSRNLRLA